MRRAARWCCVLAGVGVLVAAPAVIAARPVAGSHESAAHLLRRIERASDHVAYSGLVETHGSLSLPDIPDTGGLGGLVGGTTRVRAWWADSQHFRVDELSNDGEADTIVSGTQTIQWNSTRDEIVTTSGQQPLRVPQAGDLLPPALAARLTPDDLRATATRIGSTRIAGRDAVGLRLTPTDQITTIRYVDIDADRSTGLPLRVAVTARGRSEPSVSTDFLSVSLHSPSAADLLFVAPAQVVASHTAAPDFVADADSYAPFRLPEELAGLPRTDRIASVTGNRGAATYGHGDDLVVLLPVRPGTAAQIFHSLQPPAGTTVTLPDPDAIAVAEQIPLANVLVAQANDRSYVIAGSVSLSVLERGATQLFAHPPPFLPEADGR